MMTGKDCHETYSRQVLISGWNQNRMSCLDVSVVGASGNGANFIIAAAMIGLGEDGVMSIIDLDRCDRSNGSRIPYLRESDYGRFKPWVAKDYVKSVRPHRKVRVINKSCHSLVAQRAMAASDLIIGCVDDDFPREVMNVIAASFLVPYLDLGAGVIIGEFGGEKCAVQSGQARLFVPGVSPCLKCNMGLSREDFDRGVMRLAMDESERDLLERTGYLENLVGDDVPEPSVYTLNATVANIGMNFLVQYLLGSKPMHHTVWYGAEGPTIEKLVAESLDECPVCGKGGVIGSGEFFDIKSLVSKDEKLPEPKHVEGKKKCSVMMDCQI